MRIWTLIAAVSVALSPAAALAQETFAVGMGQEITITMDGTPKGTDPIGIEPNAFETQAGLQFSRGDHNEAIGPNAQAMSGVTPVVTPNLIRVRFTPVAGNKSGSLLVIANGYDRALFWRAFLRVRGKSSPTDVCLVMPAKTGVEYWPYPIEAIGLVDLRLEPWKPEDGIRCE